MPGETFYGEFLFPHNPAVITQERPGKFGRFFCPDHGEVIQPLGKGAREIIIKGCFISHSKEETRALVEGFEKEAQGASPKILTVAGGEPVWAVISSCSFEASGDGRAVPYTISFIEADPELLGEW